jgi:hypothetical protein
MVVLVKQERKKKRLVVVVVEKQSVAALITSTHSYYVSHKYGGETNQIMRATCCWFVKRGFQISSNSFK